VDCRRVREVPSPVEERRRRIKQLFPYLLGEKEAAVDMPCRNALLDELDNNFMSRKPYASSMLGIIDDSVIISENDMMSFGKAYLVVTSSRANVDKAICRSSKEGACRCCGPAACSEAVAAATKVTAAQRLLRLQNVSSQP